MAQPTLVFTARCRAPRRGALALAAILAAACTSPTDPATDPGAPASTVPDAQAVQVVPRGGAWLGGAARDSLGVGPNAAVHFAADSGIATVDTLGTVAGVRPGRAVVTASAGGRTARLAVLVRTVRYTAAYPRGSFDGCALTDAGEALCWGNNGSGQLGAETGVVCYSGRRFTCSPVPSVGPVFVATAERFRTLAVGDGRTCGLTPDGRSVCWGGASIDVATGATPVVSSCAAVTNGRCRFTPTDVSAGRTFQAVTIGGEVYASTMCGLAADGRVTCWGSNYNGQAGTGTRDTVPAPTPVQGDAQYRSVRLGLQHGCGLTVDGDARCWGLQGRTVLPSPTPVAPGERFVALAGAALAGGDCGLTAAGDVRCWSWYGDAPRTAAAGLQLTHVSGVCGLTAGGDAYCWDPGDPHQPAIFPQIAPVRAAAGLRFQTLEANNAREDGYGVCGVATDGVAYCFSTPVTTSENKSELVPKRIPGQG